MLEKPADSDEKLAPDVGMLEKPADSDEKLAPEMETLEKPTDSDEKLVRDEGILVRSSYETRASSTRQYWTRKC